MKAIDVELQTCKDLDVYDNVSRKTIQRGAEIIYSHILFDKKYAIDAETKRNIFLKWKERLVFDGVNRNLMKTHSRLHRHYS